MDISIGTTYRIIDMSIIPYLLGRVCHNTATYDLSMVGVFHNFM